jgi:hypothetical protein
MPLVLLLQELFDVQRPALASVERADALVDLGPELAELLDVRQQSPADLFLVGIRQIRQFSDCQFKALYHGYTIPQYLWGAKREQSKIKA